MALKIGTRVGSYEVISPLGEGGMGVVFRARDLKLQRDVALKLLPDHFADDPERLVRFQREAQVLASLNHANIAQIYGLEDSTAHRCIVMELVEGETLAERLRGGALPAAEAMHIARQVCGAMEAAHEKGIIHRDLKPANIKLTPDGKVKVLDFGLAKALETAPANPNFSNSPTLSMAATNAGVILGTAAYMSPEQAKGLSADARSDVFSFGCVLYEMLTGKQPFRGDTVSEILASVLVREPDFTALPQDLNPRLHELLHRCLDKNPKRRFHAAADLLIELDTIAGDLHATPETTEAAIVSQKRQRSWMFAFAFAALIAVVFAGLALRSFVAPVRPSEARSLIRFAVPEPKEAPFGTNIVEPGQAISPDGQRLVFRAQRQGQPATLWVRSFDSIDAKELPGTAGALFPFWSPDSRFAGFFVDGKLKKIDILGGSAQTLTDAKAEGATWNQDGTILFGTAGGGLMRVASVGGTPVAVTTPDAAAKEGSHIWPQFLPDGRHFIYITAPNWTAYLGSLDSKETKLLLRADSKVAFTPGYLLFVRGTTLTAQVFDDRSLELRGEPFPVAENIRVNNASGRSPFSVSMNGTLTYRTLTGDQVFELLWFDRSGKPLGSASMPANYQGISLSPDERQLVVHKHENGTNGGDIWLLDLVRSNLTRFTFDPAKHYEGPIWSRDGATIVYQTQTTPRVIYRKAANGAGTEEMLVQQAPDSTSMFPDSLSPDSEFLMYEERNPKTLADLWLLPMSGDRKRVSYLQTSFIEGDSQVSPNKRWISYTSNETGRMEVYLRPFPNAAGGKWQISTGGGDFSRWRSDGKELFFITYDRKLMAVDVGERNNAPEIGVPRLLFETRISYPAGTGDFYSYDVSRDGKRFIISSLPADSAQSSNPITVDLNWTAGLKK